MRVLGHLARGSEQYGLAIARHHGCLATMVRSLQAPQSALVKETAFALANLAGGPLVRGVVYVHRSKTHAHNTPTQEHVQRILDTGLVSLLCLSQGCVIHVV